MFFARNYLWYHAQNESSVILCLSVQVWCSCHGHSLSSHCWSPSWWPWWNRSGCEDTHHTPPVSCPRSQWAHAAHEALKWHIWSWQRHYYKCLRQDYEADGQCLKLKGRKAQKSKNTDFHCHSSLLCLVLSIILSFHILWQQHCPTHHLKCKPPPSRIISIKYHLQSNAPWYHSQ